MLSKHNIWDRKSEKHHYILNAVENRGEFL